MEKLIENKFILKNESIPQGWYLGDWSNYKFKEIRRDLNKEEILNLQKRAEENDKLQEIKNKISDLKQQLAACDYKAIKFAEGLMTASEYEPMKLERQSIREKIRQLENETKL